MIMEEIAANGRVRLADLVKDLGVTEPTIRKDLEDLQRRRLLKRTHGGAIAIDHYLEVPPADRTAQHREAKELIAEAVLAHLQPGQSIFLDAGTTVELVAEKLQTPRVNVLTNAVEVARMLADRPVIRHTLLGGQVRSLGGSMVGPIALDNLRRFTVDVAVLGAGGLTEEGVSVADVAEAQIKQAAIDRARTVILALDSSKFGRSHFVEVCDLTRIDLLITDAASAEVRDWCDAHGTTLQVA